jgi:hypothetical protein
LILARGGKQAGRLAAVDSIPAPVLYLLSGMGRRLVEVTSEK